MPRSNYKEGYRVQKMPSPAACGASGKLKQLRITKTKKKKERGKERKGEIS
jgi:hypothetical protein